MSETANRAELSVIVLNYRTPEQTVRAVESVVSAAEGLVTEIIVVDNASGDGSPDCVRSSLPNARLLELPTNAGFAAGMNAGMREASGDFMLLLNSDVEAAPGSISSMVTYLRGHPDVGMVAPLLVDADGRVSRTLLIEPTPARVFIPGIAKMHYDQWRGRLGNDPLEVEAAEGAAVMVRRSALEKVGPLDEEFFFYYEIVDWCMRFRESGRRVVILPEARMKHLRGGSTWRLAARIEFKRSEYRLLRKYFGVGFSRLVQVRDVLAEIVRTLFYAAVVAASLGTWRKGEDKLAVHRNALKWMAAGMPGRSDERYIRMFGGWG